MGHTWQGCSRRLAEACVDRAECVCHHSIHLITRQQQLSLVQSVTGTLTGTVLYVMSLIQHHNLLLQIDFHLAEKQHDS